MNYTNGRSYVGEWRDDLKHGYGREFDEEKELVFEGYFEEGNYLDGTFYDGDFFYKFWKNCSERPDFLSSIKNSNVDANNLSYVEIYGTDWNLKYQGGFKDGQLHGFGTYFYSNGNIYTGEWFQDLMHGKGKLSFVRKLNREEFSQYLNLQ